MVPQSLIKVIRQANIMLFRLGKALRMKQMSLNDYSPNLIC